MEAAEGQRGMFKGQMKVQARPRQACMPMNGFSPLSKGNATESYAQRESTGNVILATAQILRADPCPSKIDKLIITLLQIHEVHSYTCTYTEREHIK